MHRNEYPSGETTHTCITHIIIDRSQSLAYFQLAAHPLLFMGLLFMDWGACLKVAHVLDTSLHFIPPQMALGSCYKASWEPWRWLRPYSYAKNRRGAVGSPVPCMASRRRLIQHLHELGVQLQLRQKWAVSQLSRCDEPHGRTRFHKRRKSFHNRCC